MAGMRRVYTAHPIMILSYLKPFVFVLLIPFFKALIKAVFNRAINLSFVAETIIIMAIIGYSTIKWKNVKLLISENTVTVNTGLFLRRVAVIPINKISTIETVGHLTDYFFGSVTLRINTESGRRGKFDYEIKVTERDGQMICNQLSGSFRKKTFKFSAFRVAVMAATTSSAFTGLIFVVPVIKKVGDLLGTAIETILITRLNDATAQFDKYVPPIINMVTVIFLSLYAVSFFVFFLKYTNFHASIGFGNLEIGNGLLFRRNIRFKAQKVSSVLIEQTPLMRIFKRFLVRVHIGGYGNNRGDKAVVIPSAKKGEVRDLFSVFFPNVSESVRFVKPNPSLRRRFYIIPMSVFVAFLIFYNVLSKLFPMFYDLLTFVLIIAVVMLIYYFSLAEYNVKNSGISVARVLHARYTHGAATREMYCAANRVGVISIILWPTDKKYGTCNVKITVRSENAESIKVKHIDYKNIREELSLFYGFE